MLSKSTNTTLEAIAETLLSRDGFVICGHIHPDGDCVGSALGLALALKGIGKRAVPLIASGESLDRTLQFLPGAQDAVPAQQFDESSIDGDDVFIGVDVPAPDRLGKTALGIKERCGLSITIDHHESRSGYTDLNYTEPDSASTTMIIWKLCKLLGYDDGNALMPDLATCLLTGLITDTNRFTNQNSDVRAFEAATQLTAAGADASRIAAELFQHRTMAALKMDACTVRNSEIGEGDDGFNYVLSFITRREIQEASATYDDMDGCIDVLRSLDGIDVACILKEGDGVVRGSFRAKGNADVAALAAELGGGGHKAAAGFTVEGDIEHALSVVRTVLDGASPFDAAEQS